MPRPQILVIDEDLSIHNIMKTHLSEKYQVTYTNNRQEAFELAVAIQPKYIIADMGRDNIEWIQSIQKNNDAFIIAMSHVNQGDFVVELLKLGVFCLACKPIFIDGLLGCLKDGLELKSFSWKILSGFESWLEIEMDSQTSYINPYCSFIYQLMPEFKYKQMMLYAIKELVQNAIEHGNKYDPNKKINVCYLKTQSQMIFIVRDQGIGFDMDLLPHAVISPGPHKKNPMDVLEYRKSIGMRPGGLGIHSVSRIADELIYNEKGSCVTMIKKLPVEQQT